jgi:hypothetical protein
MSHQLGALERAEFVQFGHTAGAMTESTRAGSQPR